MSDINTNATVNLVVNGQQAQQVLQQLKQRALELENAIAKAAASGNKIELRKLRRELADTKRQIREIESSTMQVEGVMRRLDKATPKELNRALQTLNRQLDYMERGSTAWNAHVAKIQAVKAELSKVNAELRTQQSWWDRFNNKLNLWQTSLMGIAALLTGLVMAGRKAVNSYAEMEEELANTIKYTGMAREEVEAMNDAFKQMDTRTGRDKLNELAQEAGRLGTRKRAAVSNASCSGMACADTPIHEQHASIAKYRCVSFLFIYVQMFLSNAFQSSSLVSPSSGTWHSSTERTSEMWWPSMSRNHGARLMPSPMFTSTVCPFLISCCMTAFISPAMQTAEAGPTWVLRSNATIRATSARHSSFTRRKLPLRCFMILAIFG